MKNLILLALLASLAACNKEITVTTPDAVITQNTGNTTPEFIKYTILQGQQYCDKSTYVATNYSELSFAVIFDSSAIYKTIDSTNQYDINKLFGFSDNNADHHQFSARFGWRWSDDSLRLFGYTYNNGLRDSKELGTVQIGQSNNCSIKVSAQQYIFSLNGHIDSLIRESTTPTAVGYKLFPYFGGNELAPHQVTIWIKELNK